jgi:hypothetical protein
LRESFLRLRHELCPALPSSFRGLGSGRGCHRTLSDRTWVVTNRYTQSGALTETRTTIAGGGLIENGFVARVGAVGVVYWSAFTSITACL